MFLDIEALKLKTKSIAEKYDLRLVILYGSYAKNKATEKSDVDIAVLGKKKITFNEEIALNNDFAGICADLGIKEVDVKSLHNASLLFLFQVMKDGVLLFGSTYDFNSFKVYASRAYHDSYDLRKLRDIIIKKRMARLNAVLK